MRLQRIALMVFCLALVGLLGGWYEQHRAAEPVADAIVRAHGRWYDHLAKGDQVFMMDAKRQPETDDRALRRVLTPQLGFAPVITKPADKQFSFQGARMETVLGHPACSLVFKHKAAYIELYEWPAPEHRESLTYPMDYHGNHLCRWFQAGLECWAITPVAMDLAEFHRCVGLLRARMGD